MFLTVAEVGAILPLKKVTPVSTGGRRDSARDAPMSDGEMN
jgi:hypothetical protein